MEGIDSLRSGLSNTRKPRTAKVIKTHESKNRSILASSSSALIRINTADFRTLQPQTGHQAFLIEDERIHAILRCRSS